ncbi:hypothetical protein Vadar_026494 [Vaccinium darrowii]|uniref:Uncharacterized protein n=1 Tax=Vaccinium darrowii TaxID=229202 RepID=A0ACB7X4F4_9ERIC|nr:hypothetical protein Vadar_026494 [Vaccinium darrowii]
MDEFFEGFTNPFNWAGGNDNQGGNAGNVVGVEPIDMSPQNIQLMAQRRKQMAFAIHELDEFLTSRRRLNVVEILEERGLLEALTNENLKSVCSDPDLPPLRFYCGFDPTDESLHLGNLLGIIVLSWFLRYGHKNKATACKSTMPIEDLDDVPTKRPAYGYNIFVADFIRGLRLGLGEGPRGFIGHVRKSEAYEQAGIVWLEDRPPTCHDWQAMYKKIYFDRKATRRELPRTRKRKRGDEVENWASIRTRYTPKQLVDLNKALSEERRDALVKRNPFHNLLQLNCDWLNREFCVKLVEWFNMKTHSLEFWDERVCPIRKEDFERVLGMPSGSRDAIGPALFPAMTCAKMAKIKTYRWPTFIMEQLVNQIKSFKDRASKKHRPLHGQSVGGCLFLLMIIYFDRFPMDVMSGEHSVEHQLPIALWTNDLMVKGIRMEPEDIPPKEAVLADFPPHNMKNPVIFY